MFSSSHGVHFSAHCHTDRDTDTRSQVTNSSVPLNSVAKHWHISRILYFGILILSATPHDSNTVKRSFRPLSASFWALRRGERVKEEREEESNFHRDPGSLVPLMFTGTRNESHEPLGLPLMKLPVWFIVYFTVLLFISLSSYFSFSFLFNSLYTQVSQYIHAMHSLSLSLSPVSSESS